MSIQDYSLDDPRTDPMDFAEETECRIAREIAALAELISPQYALIRARQIVEELAEELARHAN